MEIPVLGILLCFVLDKSGGKRQGPKHISLAIIRTSLRLVNFSFSKRVLAFGSCIFDVVLAIQLTIIFSDLDYLEITSTTSKYLAVEYRVTNTDLQVIFEICGRPRNVLRCQSRAYMLEMFTDSENTLHFRQYLNLHQVT
ncbi:uncharacterized protein LY89DRAFT_181632 [Mollisia scopiformis]|uniref:Uncharacterized protein n=1 Tax=Mollisia scopiformis TaxID=149040 RepID=A0A194XSX8_MOLSC|nr:uncharacterized protein LY89DRAFT_181632 [Mollisia scopiformis]KUJ23410.1 hypothetical protein LY89DRAFT_181632 [Mollisia scopiformis]